MGAGEATSKRLATGDEACAASKDVEM